MSRTLLLLGLLLLAGILVWAWMDPPSDGEDPAGDAEAPLAYETRPGGPAGGVQAEGRAPVLEADAAARLRHEAAADAAGADAAAADPTGPYALTAIRWETAMPLRGVKILPDDVDAEALGETDEDGRWALEDAGTPRLAFRAVLDGYVEQRGILQPGTEPEIVLFAGVPIAGRVLREGSRAPLALANVRVWDVDLDTEIANTTADEEGRFRLAAVRPHHPQRLVVTAPGLVPHLQSQTFEGAEDDYEILVGEGGHLHGRVRDENGVLLAKTEVRLLRPGEPLFEQRPDQIATPEQAPRRGLVEVERARTAVVHTDEQGRYGFHGVPLGVVVQPVAVLTPRHLARGKNARFDARTTDQKIDLQAQAPATLRIRVADGNDLPLGHAHLQILVDGSVVPPMAADQWSDGAFVLEGLGPGGVSVTATIPGRPTRHAKGTLVAGRATELSLSLPVGREVLGEVRDKRGKPIWKALVSWRGRAPRETTSVRTDLQGRFVLHGLEAEDGTLLVAARDLPHTQRAYEFAKLEFVRPGEGRQFITLKDGTKITGRFRDLPPNAIVTCELLGGTPQDAGRLRLDGQGRFEWRGPEPFVGGRTWAFRTHGLPPLIVHEPNAFQSEESRDVGVLSFEATNPRRGQIVDERGRPIHAALVTLAHGWSDRSTRTDTQGHFGFGRVPDEDLRIRVRAKGYPPVVTTLATKSQYTRQVIRLRAGRWVTIEVKLKRGQPVAAAIVGVQEIAGRGPPPADLAHQVRTDAKGQVRMYLPFGQYRARVYDPRTRFGASQSFRVLGKGDGYVAVELKGRLR